MSQEIIDQIKNERLIVIVWATKKKADSSGTGYV